MPVDTSIIGRIQPAQITQVDPMERYGRMLGIQNAMQQGELHGLQTNAARRGIADEDALRSAYQQAGGDSARLRVLLQQGGQHKALEALNKSDLEQRAKEAGIGKDTAAAAKSQYEVDIGKLQHGASLLDTAKDQDTYDAALRIGTITGTFTPQASAQFPKQYDPRWVEATKAAGLTHAQKLEDQRKREEFGLKAANEPFAAPAVPGGAAVPNLPVQQFQLTKAAKTAPNVNVKVENPNKAAPEINDPRLVQQVAILTARSAHEVNRAYCRFLGDESQAPWDNAPDWQKASIMNGVIAIMRNPSLTPAQSHSCWMAEKLKESWVYGPVKDTVAKTHPCLVPYDKLPREQILKDVLFGAVVRASLGIPQ